MCGTHQVAEKPGNARVVSVREDIHRRLKVAAAERGMKLGEFVSDLLEVGIARVEASKGASK